MSRRTAAALVAVAAAVVVAGIFSLPRSPRAAAPAPREAMAPVVAVEPPSPPESRLVTLWLPAAQGRLAVRAAEVTSAPEIRARLAALLAALLAAADDGTTSAVFPAPVAAASLLLVADGTLYVDLRPSDGGAPPGAGSTLETQRIYSIVHTVLRNEPRVERVVLLWNGVQRESLTGHVDTRRPLGLRPDLESR